MPVGSHKDAFKAHQLVKKLIDKERDTPLARLAADILLDFVKNQRQISSDGALNQLPEDTGLYDSEKVSAALAAVGCLCGQCAEAHDDACFVNQARRLLIAAKTGVDIGSSFDGKTSFDVMLHDAEERAAALRSAQLTLFADEKSDVPVRAINDFAPVACAADGGLAMSEREELEALREKDVFRATLIDEVVQTIRSVTSGNYAAAMPVHDDEQLGKLATAFNLMLQNVNTTMSSLDALVKERSSELKQIMDTVPLGLLSLNAEYHVNPEYSTAAAQILGVQDLRGHEFAELLGLTRRREGERKKLLEYLELVGMQVLSAGDLAQLNPFDEMQLSGEGAERWVRLRFHPLKTGNAEATPDILVEIEDISEAKRLAEQVAASKQENMQIMAIAEDPDLFREFLAESAVILNRVSVGLDTLDSAEDWMAEIHAMFRGVHTIKGSSGCFGLLDVAERAAGLEDVLGEAREMRRLPEGFSLALQPDLQSLQEALSAAAAFARTILGEDEGGDGPSVRIGLGVLQELESFLLLERPSVELRQAMVRKILALQELPAKKALARSVKLVPGLLKRLEKEAVFAFEGEDVPLPYELGQKLNIPLTHMLRNAFDHGLEDAEERLAAEKSTSGMVMLQVKRAENMLVVVLSDDGKGLDPEKLRQSALRKGVITPEEAAELKPAECQQLIFRPGFSTAQSVSDVSGRGVGMDAVLHTVREELGGTIMLDSIPGKGTVFTIRIPLVQPVL